MPSPQDHDTPRCCSGNQCAAPDTGGPAARTPTAPRDIRSAHQPPFTHFRIANMDCASEEGEIRHTLDGMPGVHALQFRLGDRVLGISADEAALPQALAAIRKAGFKPEPLRPGQRAAPASQQPGSCCSDRHQGCHSDAHRDGIREGSLPESGDGFHPSADGDFSLPPPSFWQQWGKLLTALVLALGAEVLAFASGHSGLLSLFGMALAAIAIFLAGFSVYGKGIAALKQGRLNINALMTVAVTGAFLIGQWPEAAMVMALYSLAETIEARAVDRARHAIKSLLALTPDEAEVQQADGSWRRGSVGAVSIDAIVRVRPGERVPLDGVVLKGHSSLDQSPITGESLPVDKVAGDEVFAGTINQTGELEIRVSSLAHDSTLARIIHAVEEAQSARAPTQRFVDRFATVYTPAVFIIAVALALLLPLLGHSSWLQGIYTALVLLVIACPCALVISTPVTVVSALAAAARRGILIKGGVWLEEARNIRAVALDKTGTITEGRPRLVALEAVAPSVSEQTVRQLIKSLAARSDHPVSRAMAEGLAATPPLPVTEFQAVAGRGTQASIDIGGLMAGASTYVLANHRWIEELGQCSEALEARLAIHEAAGRTVTLLANGERVLALAAVADTIRPSSAEAIATLKAEGVTPVMLTGDNLATARHVATQAGIDDVQANLLPEEKLEAIAGLQQRHGSVAMTGDGINDAPALARADIGFAMGAAGTHTAMEAADIVIMNDDLRRVPETIALSRRAHRVLWQNISLALGIKFVFLVMAILGQATMWMAVFADMGASLLVVFNGLRLLRWQSPHARSTPKNQ
ncbi:MAG: heavy metal translocating P-type ATPase [Lautropia sp.]|nr:heavy metal translocating P-type ATPase [Lautropia sp.]